MSCNKYKQCMDTYKKNSITDTPYDEQYFTRKCYDETLPQIQENFSLKGNRKYKIHILIFIVLLLLIYLLYIHLCGNSSQSIGFNPTEISLDINSALSSMLEDPLDKLIKLAEQCELK